MTRHYIIRGRDIWKNPTENSPPPVKGVNCNDNGPLEKGGSVMMWLEDFQLLRIMFLPYSLFLVSVLFHVLVSVFSHYVSPFSEKSYRGRVLGSI